MNNKAVYISLIIVLIIVGLIYFVLVTDQPGEQEVETTAVLDDQEKAEVTAWFKADLPVKVLAVFAVDDGGTKGARLEDKNGTELEFCLDGRMRVMGFKDLLLQDLGKEPEPYHFYIGAIYPELEEAIKIPYGGAKEQQLLKMLQGSDTTDLDSSETELLEMITEELKSRAEFVGGST